MLVAHAQLQDEGRVLLQHLSLTEVLFGALPPLDIPVSARRRAAVVLALADRPRARWTLGQAAFIPRSFSAERMVAIHGGPGDGVGLWATRTRHALHGAIRRMRR